jgi:hypothetical protein
MLIKAIPVLPVISVRESVDFYTCKLGFTGVNLGDHAILHYKNVQIRLQMATAKRPFHKGSCYFFTDDVECLYADFSAKELIYPKNQLAGKPRGVKEFTVQDNNGNLLYFAQVK